MYWCLIEQVFNTLSMGDYQQSQNCLKHAYHVRLSTRAILTTRVVTIGSHYIILISTYCIVFMYAITYEWLYVYSRMNRMIAWLELSMNEGHACSKCCSYWDPINSSTCKIDQIQSYMKLVTKDGISLIVILVEIQGEWGICLGLWKDLWLAKMVPC